MKGVEAVFADIRFPASVKFNQKEEFVLIQVLPSELAASKLMKLRMGEPFVQDDDLALIISDSLLSRLKVKEFSSALGKEIEISTLAFDFSRINPMDLSSLLQGDTLPFARESYTFRITGIAERMGFGGPTPLRSDVFDHATSFLGMRDIYMTRGRKGVESTIEEMIRASKKTGRIALAVTPPDLAEVMAVRVAIDVEGEVFGARSMPSTFYTELLKENGVDATERKLYSTGLMMTTEQTKVELKEGIEIVKEIYGRDVQDFDEVWTRYGSTIERHGYGMYSKITVISGKKARPLPPL